MKKKLALLLALLMLVSSFPACSSSTTDEYTGSGFEFNGELTVTVTIADGAITKITLDEHIDDDDYMSNATNIRKKIIEAQEIDVDVITGATYSSNGIKDAVLDALS